MFMCSSDLWVTFHIQRLDSIFTRLLVSVPEATATDEGQELRLKACGQRGKQVAQQPEKRHV